MGELFEFKNGLSKGKEFFGRGTPFITFSDVFNHNFLHKSDIKSLVECSEEEKQKLHVGRGDVLFTRTSETAEDVGHSSVMLDDIGDCVFNGFTIRATPKTKELLPEYCAYCFCTDSFRNYVTKNCAFTTRASLTGSTIAEYKLPVPSLALQKRIANVLGNFDKICSDLNIGLPAEIGLRKKQYEYYRDRILSFNTNVNNSIHGGGNLQDEIKLLQYVFGYAMVRLGDIATQFRGEYITQKNSKKGEIPVILGGLEPAYYIDKPNHYGEIIVVSRSGASAGFVSQWNEPIFITDGFGFEAKKEITSHKFLYYSLKNRERNLNEMKRGAGVPHVSGEMLNDVVFPIPSITEQERIVAILDKFDALVNDLSQGIPAEIEARKKQYER